MWVEMNKSLIGKNISDINADLEIERAIKFLVYKIDESGHNPKPVILHSIRVERYLESHNYSKNILIAAVLHDILEDTDTSIETIQRSFGKEIAALVEANTFDKMISDETEKYRDCFNRCFKKGRDALVIKAADILDNSRYYHLSKDRKLNNFLLQKMKYFIDLSKPLLRNEPIYSELKKQYRQLVKLFFNRDFNKSF